MAESPLSKAPTRTIRNPKKDLIGLAVGMAVLVAIGVGFSMLINFFDLDNKVEAPNYPGSEKASLTPKGQGFIEDKYINSKPTKDYYKIMLTADSCETVLNYYRTEVSKNGWKLENQEGVTGSKAVLNSYSKDSKGLFVYCVPGSEQLVQNDSGKNSIILTTADNVIKISL
jgi:hypothetical protein